MSRIQQQAKALGEPTRHHIFRYLVDAARPVDVAELTAHLGLNHNAIRQHLAKLVEAELVVEQTAPSAGRGRPRLRYVPHPATDSRWGVMGPYERLSLLLAEIVRSGETPVEVGRRAGRALPLAGGAVDAIGELVDQMARQGFEPEVTRQGDRVEVILGSCPFATIALADPGTVCALHLGMAHGIAEAAGGLVVEGLDPTDPRDAHCRLRCRAEPSPT